MMGFGDLLSGAGNQALADWSTPVVPAPRWTAADITASRIATPLPAGTPNTPLWQADPMNLFVVVEGGDHHISLLDGDKFDHQRFPKTALPCARRAQIHWRTGVTCFSSRDGMNLVRPVPPAGGGRGARGPVCATWPSVPMASGLWRPTTPHTWLFDAPV